jgi:hypothetical protein
MNEEITEEFLLSIGFEHTHRACIYSLRTEEMRVDYSTTGMLYNLRIADARDLALKNMTRKHFLETLLSMAHTQGKEIR